MSRIGNNPIIIPDGVTINFNNNVINVKGKLGELSQEINPNNFELTQNTGAPTSINFQR